MKMNIGILAHVDAGKTTITEQMLYTCGVINEIGRVDNGNTTTDGMSLERSRGITIRQATVTMCYKTHTINLLDTPGHVDFIAEVERSLSVLDAAVLAISAKEGVQTQTKVIYNALKKAGIPVVLMINKVDRMGVDMEVVMKQIRNELSEGLYMINRVVDAGERFAALDDLDDGAVSDNLEALALLDEQVFESWSSGEIITPDIMTDCAKRYFNAGKLMPILNGAALLGLGIEPLLDVLTEWVEPRTQAHLSALVYKVDRDAHGARRCFTRVFGGHIVLRETYPIYGDDQEYKILKMDGLRGIKPVRQDVATAGDVVVLYTDALSVGTVLGEPPFDKQLVHIASPTLKASVMADDLAVRRQVCDALVTLSDEDPFLDFEIHPETEAISLKLFGMVQKEIIEQMLKERFNIETQILEPEIVYKATPISPMTACIYMYKAGNFLPATVGIVIEPLKIGEGVRYETEVSFGDLKKPFQNAVREGSLVGLKKGVNGLEVTDVRVRFVYSEFDSVNSTPSDYRKVAEQVVGMALGQVAASKLEPMSRFELVLPQLLIGKAIADILRMRGTFEDPIVQGDLVILKGVLPQATSQYYSVELADYSGGKGIISFEFAGYQMAPENV
ncbi:MAG: TetM/TetW/TetO/TetS family tetracycline resistance ribosomal protection protein [Firmicutes bacterium]|nr:TetM/TetW/TetO/TetS family tetracycline resistance ribosomal protection protein [Bacillota bacterium]